MLATEIPLCAYRPAWRLLFLSSRSGSYLPTDAACKMNTNSYRCRTSIPRRLFWFPNIPRVWSRDESIWAMIGGRFGITCSARATLTVGLGRLGQRHTACGLLSSHVIPASAYVYCLTLFLEQGSGPAAHGGIWAVCLRAVGARRACVEGHRSRGL